MKNFLKDPVVDKDRMEDLGMCYEVRQGGMRHPPVHVELPANYLASDEARMHLGR